MRNLRPVIAFSLLLLWVAPSSSWACSCRSRSITESEVQAAVERAKAVFRGEVLDIVEVRTPDFATPPGFNPARMVSFKVSEVWKGSDWVHNTVFSGDGQSDCGFVFEIGKKYVVFASSLLVPVAGALNTSNCEFTALESESAELLKLLGAGKPSKDGTRI
jgi:hypothetical protein